MKRLAWYANRLRLMGPREALWRADRAAKGFLPVDARYRDAVAIGPKNDPELWVRALDQFRNGRDRPVLLDRTTATSILREKPALVADLVNAADTAAEGTFQFFGYPPVRLNVPIQWNVDPIGGQLWPMKPSNRINHRVIRGDPKWVWELNRLQHLPWLAQAWLFTADSRYSRAAFAQLDNWIEQNPRGYGIAWRGAFEASLRAISVAVALQGLRDAPELTTQRYRRIVNLLAQSACLCWRERSLYSSANNHLIGEMTGLAVVAIMFPELRHAGRWERRAVEILADEATKQIRPDGSGAEQAISYQMFSAELLNLVSTLLVRRDGFVPEALTDAVARSSAYLSSLVSDDAPLPRYGDDDDGFALRLGPQPCRTLADHLQIVAGFRHTDSSSDQGGSCLDADWFTPPAHARAGAGGQVAAPRSGSGSPGFVAPDGGLVVLHSADRRTTMDVGPLGYLSIAAHGHADSLSITLSMNGHEIISDPGTASYYAHPHWRDVMRGTRAHATVCVDGLDQSVSGGPFMWLKHAQTRLLGADLSHGIIDAEHDGYTRLPGHIKHRRWLVAPPNGSVQLVVDLITGTGDHEIRTTWPLHPSLDAAPVAGGHLIIRNEKPVMQLLSAATVALQHDEVRGDSERDYGWWSDRLESRMPAWWLGAVCNAELPVVIATLMSTVNGVAVSALTVEIHDGRIRSAWRENGHLRTVVIDPDRPAAVNLQSE